MKSKPPGYGLHYGPGDGRVCAAARWGASTALALGWLAALGVFASPGGSGGPAATASRMGLVRLAIQEIAPASAREESGAEQKTRQPSPPEESTKAPTDAQNAAAQLPLREGGDIATQKARSTVATMDALEGREGKPSPTPQSPRLPEPPPAAAKPSGTEKSKISNPAAESTASATGKNSGRKPVQSTVKNTARNPTDTTGNNAAQTNREMEVAQLDEGFGLLRPVWPAYPALAKRLGKAGRVRLELGIDPQGRVYRVKVVDDISGWGFGLSAELAYRNARFTRPTVGGHPVRVLWRKTVIFRP